MMEEPTLEEVLTSIGPKYWRDEMDLLAVAFGPGVAIAVAVSPATESQWFERVMFRSVRKGWTGESGMPTEEVHGIAFVYRGVVVDEDGSREGVVADFVIFENFIDVWEQTKGRIFRDETGEITAVEDMSLVEDWPKWCLP